MGLSYSPDLNPSMWSVKSIGGDLELLALEIGPRRPLLLADPCRGNLDHISLVDAEPKALACPRVVQGPPACVKCLVNEDGVPSTLHCLTILKQPCR